jgi:hypothetical protein
MSAKLGDYMKITDITTCIKTVASKALSKFQLSPMAPHNTHLIYNTMHICKSSQVP